nr:glycoside hydrolase family 3 N-terminal domain-containing protein [Massilia sp. Se16.2.3]
MMTAHIVYPALDAEYPATMSQPILTGILRDGWGYEGVIITDGMDMHAIAHRYGAGQAAVRALVVGADMVMAIGSRETQEETVAAIAAAIASGELPMAQVQQKLARLGALAAAHPAGATTGTSAGVAAGTGALAAEPDAPPGADEAPVYSTDAADRALMARAWRRALSARGQVVRPPAGSRLRPVARQDVVSDGVSEAGVPAAQIAASLGQLYDVELVTFADAESFDWAALPQTAASRCWPRPRAAATARTRKRPGALTCTWPCGTPTRHSTSTRRP